MDLAQHRVEILAGTPPGGGQDRAARALADALDVEAKIVNVPGRGGGNAWDALAIRAGDQHVVSISSPTIITNRELGIAQIDDRDLTVLAHLCLEHLAFVVSDGGPVADVADLVEAFAGPGVGVAIATERGNVNHIAVAEVAKSAGVDPARVPVRVFDSARDAIADVLRDGADVAVVSAASAIPELESGGVRIVAVTADERMAPPFDKAPTWVESGVDCAIGTWRGLVGPPAMTDEEIESWDLRIGRAVAGDPWGDSVQRHHWSSVPLDHLGAGAFLDQQRETLAQGLRDLGLSRHG